MLTMKLNRWAVASNEQRGVWLAVLAAAGFSMKAVFVKLAYGYGTVSPITLLTLRMLLAMPLFMWLCRSALRKAPPLSPGQWLGLVILGLLGYYGSSILDFMGLQTISAALERLILFTYPTMTLVINVVVMRHASTPRQWGAVALTYAGIALVFVHDLGAIDNTSGLWLGASLVLASALSYALYNVGAERMLHHVGALRFAVLASGVSTIACLLHFSATEPLQALNQPWPVWACCAAMALVSTALPVVWQSSAIQLIGSSRAVLIGTLGPMLTLGLSWLVLGEAVSVLQLLGASAVLAGVWLVSFTQKRRAPPART